MMLGLAGVFPHVVRAQYAENIEPRMTVNETEEPAKESAISEAKPPDSSTPPQALLMTILSKAGLGEVLEKLGINVYGYSEGGLMFDPSVPQNHKGPTYLGFDNLKKTPVLDKISLSVERPVDPSKKKFDLGFKGEGIWGYDSQFVHSNGLWDKQSGRYQWDPLQLYVDAAAPYLPMRFRVGKWIELAGFEHFDANMALAEWNTGAFSFIIFPVPCCGWPFL
jgi:hypothetical protein